jgi:intein-encoded DNA endonuclease-like protein
MSKDKIRRCEYCNKVLFHTTPSRIKAGKGKYCNKICFIKGKHYRTFSIPLENFKYEIRKCEGCGKILPHIPPSRIKDGRGKYCSKSCSYKYVDHRRNIIPIERFKPTPEFAYCIGSFRGDGSWGKIGNCIRISLNVIDRDFVETFQKAFSFWSGLKSNSIYRSHPRYGVSFSSCDLLPFINFDLKELLETNDKTKSNFIKGIADAEGYVNFKGYSRYIKIVNYNLKLLKITQILLKMLNIESTIYSIRKGIEFNGYQLYIGGQRNVREYCEKIGFTIHRKQETLRNAVDSYVNNMS